MSQNRLAVKINLPVNKVFLFATTPPNTTRWLDGVVSETTNEWPIQVGTVYEMTDPKGKISRIVVVDIRENYLIEWMSEDKNYHCRYILTQADENSTNFDYYEWVDVGEIPEPFTDKTLQSFKEAAESA